MQELIARLVRLADDGDIGSPIDVERALGMQPGILTEPIASALTAREATLAGTAGRFNVLLTNPKGTNPPRATVLHLFPSEEIPAEPVLAMLKQVFGAAEFLHSPKGHGGWVSYSRSRAELVFTFDYAAASRKPAAMDTIMLFEKPICT